jgi:ATP:ADP antiporter, AAA family
MSTDDQRRSARIATISALMVVAAFTAGKAARDAILLSRFSIKSLPLFVGLAALIALPIIIIAGRLMVRFGPARLVPVMTAASGLASLGEWLLIGGYPRPIAIVAFFHLSTASAVLVSGFWSIVNERFDIHTAKQHIGRIGMGATIGGILGGAIAERTAVYLAPDTILLVLAGMQLVCAITLALFGRGATRAREPEPVQVKTWAALAGVAKSQLLRNVGILVMLTAISAGALDYVFKADMVAGGSSGLLRSFAVFYTVTNIITALVQITLCGPIISKIGVPRSIATLPIAITGFSALSIIARVPLSATLARGSELVTRNSVYRAGYELLYAPLPPEQKRPTKVVLDVGADRVGDLLAAQMVGAIVFLVADSRTALLVAALAVGALAILIAMRLPGYYTKALEASLLAAEPELPPVEDRVEPWITLTDMPSFGHPGDVIPLRLRNRKRGRAATAQPAPPNDTERLIELVRELRSNNPQQVKRALANPLPTDVVSIAIELVAADDDIAREAIKALCEAAPRCTGMLIDAMLDRTRDAKLRCRLPSVVARGEGRLAAWGLWRGLDDPSFDVRYQCASVLAPLASAGHLVGIAPDDVFERVRFELAVDPSQWKAGVDALLESHAEEHTNIGLAHVFRVLGLVLPAEPLLVALRAVQADDPSLRGTALEYLESVLPPDVHAKLWPLLDPEHEQDTLAAVQQKLAP